MALRPRGLSRPPATGNVALDRYLQEVAAAIEGLPLSYFSTSDGPNTSGVTAPKGTIGREIGSSVTAFWFKTDDSSLTTGWSQVSFI